MAARHDRSDIDEPVKAMENGNLWPLLLLAMNVLTWKIPVTKKRTIKTADAGTSGIGEGGFPRLAILGGYGGPFICMSENVSRIE